VHPHPQYSCSVSVSLDHRSTATGALDVERSLTCRRLAELYQEFQEKGLALDEACAELGREFHTPGHVSICRENDRGLKHRAGHMELSVALAKAARVTPVVVSRDDCLGRRALTAHSYQLKLKHEPKLKSAVLVQLTFQFQMRSVRKGTVIFEVSPPQSATPVRGVAFDCVP
jgi:3,4-dihydroxy-2-butanone 4-phosphate synthase